ncbi:MAG: FecR domain-containing protein, partial [Gammaproteobacteria bacterium]
MRTNRAGMLLGVLSVFPVGAPQAAAPCIPWAAKIVSIEGRVEASRIGDLRWVPARLKQTFCPGDRLRIESRSRAAVLLPNQTVLRLDERTALTFTQVKPGEPSLLDLLKGAIHFLSRTPAQLRINTPFAAAGVEGTEFVLRVAEGETRLWVFEGRVRFVNAKGSLLLASREAAAAQAGRAPQRRVVVRPREAVQWALYYPPLIDHRLTSYPSGPGGPDITEALKFYRQDDLTSAFASLDKVPDEAREASYYTLSAGLLLNVGRVDEGRVDIDQALKLDPKNATAYALQSVIALVQNEQEQAFYLARKAEELDPQSPIPKVALSYAYQAKFDIEKALQNIEQAIALAPTDALAYARLAELQLSRGDLERAINAAKTAVALDPDLARTQAVLGFAYLTEIDIDRAKATFQKAIELDPASPLPRLGLGLAKIRDGDLKEGTQEIEIAASLDPNNSLVRSYLGKAYFEEKRGGLASSEFEIAKQLDPKDPTPWFYDAIHKQTTNRPVEALHDLQKAIELNDNRAVYRSRLLLDEDLAARSASLGRIYNELAFEQLGRVQAWNALSTDPSAHSAHRLLSDTYAGLPRHDVARVSELLQSQLLQPINITPVQPQLAESDLFLLGGLGPSALSLNEFNPLFERERLSLLVSGLAASNDTYSDEVVHSGLWNRLSYSIGQFHYETGGFRPNSDLDTNIYSIFGQYALAPRSNVQVELRHQDTESGDLRELFNPEFIFEEQQIEFERDTARIGFGFELRANTKLLGSLAYREINRDQVLPIFEPFSVSFDGTPGISSLLLPLLPAGFNREQSAKNDAENSSFELQYLQHGGRFNLILGGGYTYQQKMRMSLSTGRLTTAIPPDLAEQIQQQLAVQDP